MILYSCHPDGELGSIVLNCEATASTPEELKVLIAAYKSAASSDVKTIELMILDDQFRPVNPKILLAQ